MDPNERSMSVSVFEHMHPCRGAAGQDRERSTHGNVCASNVEGRGGAEGAKRRGVTRERVLAVVLTGGGPTARVRGGRETDLGELVHSVCALVVQCNYGVAFSDTCHIGQSPWGHSNNFAALPGPGRPQPQTYSHECSDPSVGSRRAHAIPTTEGGGEGGRLSAR